MTAPLLPVALDLETPLFGVEESLLPRPITYSLAWRENGELRSWMIGNGDEGTVAFLLRLFMTPGLLLVLQNGAFDLAVLRKHHPELRVAIARLYFEGRVYDTKNHEILKAISTRGTVRSRINEEGDREDVFYSLGALMMTHYGVDRSADKEAEDAVRYRYVEMDGRKASEYPADFERYARQDPTDTLLIYESQLLTPGSCATQELQAAAHIALTQMTHNGIAIDEEEVERLSTLVAAELVPEKLKLLLSSKILRPGHDGLPAANGSQEHVDGCDKFGCECCEIQPKRKAGAIIGYQRKHAKGCARERCDCPPKMTQPTPASIDTRKLHERVLVVCATNDLSVHLTDTAELMFGAETFPAAAWSEDTRLRNDKGKPFGVSVSGDFLHELAAHDPVLHEYRHRARLAKIVSYLANLREAIDFGYPYVHPSYDLLKETGRTSSFGKKKGDPLGSLKAPVPSIQGQNIPNPPKVTKLGLEFLDDIDPRSALKPRPGMVFVNADYSGLEHVTLAQRCLNLFGFSRHAEIINGGRGCHAYLGAQILVEVGDKRSPEVAKFLTYRDVRSAVRRGDRIALHDCFVKYATGTKAERKCYKRYRTTSKPVGLGFPGMLGARKMAYHIFPQYNLEATEVECAKLKAIWFDSYPEMPFYFEHIKNNRRDPENPGRYRYEAWGGFTRANCTVNAAANGEGMQTDGAMGAKCGLALVDREVWDPSAGSILYQRFDPILFVHDEILGETPDDETAHFVAVRVGQLMEEGLQMVCPDVAASAEPLLTRRFSKDAEPVYNEQRLLIPWEPEPVGA